MLSPINGTLSRSSVGTKVLQSIRNDIIIGNYEPGTKLTELSICERYGISRTSARQIIYQLEYEGLLVMLDNGCKCTVDFTTCDIDYLYELRNYYEITAIKHIFKNGTCTLSDFADIIIHIENAKNLDQTDILKADIDYHRSVVALSGDKFIMKGYDNIAPILYTIFLMCSEVNEQHFVKKFYKEHMELTETILFNKYTECISYIEEHHKDVEERAKNAFEIIKKRNGRQ